MHTKKELVLKPNVNSHTMGNFKRYKILAHLSLRDRTGNLQVPHCFACRSDRHGNCTDHRCDGHLGDHLDDRVCDGSLNLDRIYPVPLQISWALQTWV